MTQPANENYPRGWVVAVAECEDQPGAWTVEAVNEAGEGEICQAIFIGPDAEQFARAWAAICWRLFL